MVRNAADKLAAHKAEKDQSSLDNISLVNQSLPPSLSSSVEKYYSDSDLEQQTVQQPSNSAQRKKNRRHGQNVSSYQRSYTKRANKAAAQRSGQLGQMKSKVKWHISHC